MIDYPKTKKEAMKYEYGKWAGNPGGRAYDPLFCAYEIWGKGRNGLAFQCGRRPGHGADKLYCQRHAKIIAWRAGR